MQSNYIDVGNNDSTSILMWSGIFGMGMKSHIVFSERLQEITNSFSVWGFYSLCRGFGWVADNRAVMKQMNFEVGNSFSNINAV